ncbi:MAG: class I SAM-dependent methyltransferase [Proteobacteria bacterium]|uniref:class I SAM-dependent methyltransferase n=1 Tax=Aquabacterium sp. TaxID=1872578 RepID=UPI0035C77FED|nr:class I SAM-dependent methyltransferase [Pseudomonadota bacterium]
MNSTTAPRLASSTTQPVAIPRAARQVLQLLERLPIGQLELQLPDGRTLRCPTRPAHRAEEAPAAPRASLQVHDWGVFERTLRSGDIGFAEGYIEGQWDSPDLAGLMRLMLANRGHIERVVYGTWWGALWHRLRHLRRRNTRTGSARNIHAHYDLGNSFYRLWLDPTMSYSAALFDGQDRATGDLQEAQRAKVRRALKEARVQAGSRVLEIGCGWGGLAEVAARECQAHVTGVTLSREQLQWAQALAHSAGLDHLTEFRYQDYRDLPRQHAGQPFDAIVSIEMFEAVGREYWGDYFKTLHACLKPGGQACVQTITIRDDLFDRYVRSTDFIQQYIFPGGLLPSPAMFEKAAREAGFEVVNRFAFGPDYAETLRRWRAAFDREIERVQTLGFDPRFVRIWTFYLTYCEAAFDSGNTDVMQFTLRKRP